MLFCFARAPWMLLVGRIFQGLSASVIYTAGLALIADAVDPDEIGAWYGPWNRSIRKPSLTS